ncbi:MAG TPA: hypothetical protein VMN82_02915 [Thermoanaerobaculia bacterium]|nr:hypothetical protein [Thermoanaerobaculia bacterium]
MTAGAEAGREFLRHTVATLAYRGGKALRGAPASFAGFRAGEGSRSAGEILAHVGDLLDWALALAKGEKTWRDSPPLSWEAGTARFFEALERFDAYLASSAPLGSTPEKLFQGPVADGLAHVGQIALLRRLASAPIRGENYYKADIESGRVGAAQAAPRLEFD